MIRTHKSRLTVLAILTVVSLVLAACGIPGVAGSDTTEPAHGETNFSITNPIDTVHGNGVRALFLYGVSFGIASLSCTLPIFLMVVGSALSAGNLVQGLIPFIGYSGGMAFVVVGLTLATALLKGALVQQMRRVLPYVNHLSGLLLLAAGAYIVYLQVRFSVFLPQ